MLVLTRKQGEAIRIDENVIVRIKQISGNRVRISIEAPRTVPVHREEVSRRIQAEREFAGRSTLLRYLQGPDRTSVPRADAAS